MEIMLPRRLYGSIEILLSFFRQQNPPSVFQVSYHARPGSPGLHPEDHRLKPLNLRDQLERGWLAAGGRGGAVVQEKRLLVSLKEKAGTPRWPATGATALLAIVSVCPLFAT